MGRNDHDEVVSGASAQVFPIPTVPLVDQTGRPTPAWYRFFVSLVQRTGGTAGRITPLPPDPFQVTLSDVFGGESESRQLMLDLGQEDSNNVGGNSSVVLSLGDDGMQYQMVFTDVSSHEGANVYNYFADCYQECGSQVLVEDTGIPSPPETVTVGVSPASFSPLYDGFAVVYSGTVSKVEISRNGVAYDTGVTSGSFPLAPCDTLIVTYTVAPTVTFFRR